MMVAAASASGPAWAVSSDSRALGWRRRVVGGGVVEVDGGRCYSSDSDSEYFIDPRGEWF